MHACGGVKDLTPLKGMPLKHLDIGLNPQIAHLRALKGMPLKDVRIDNCPKIKDISVLKKMPLKFLSIFGNKAVKDYSVIGTLKLETLCFTPTLLKPEELQQLRNIKSLKRLATSWAEYRKERSPEEFWRLFEAQELKKTR